MQEELFGIVCCIIVGYLSVKIFHDDMYKSVSGFLEVLGFIVIGSIIIEILSMFIFS